MRGTEQSNASCVQNMSSTNLATILFLPELRNESKRTAAFDFPHDTARYIRFQYHSSAHMFYIRHKMARQYIFQVARPESQTNRHYRLDAHHRFDHRHRVARNNLDGKFHSIASSGDQRRPVG